MSVDFEGMRLQAVYAIEKLVDFLEEHKKGDVVEFEVHMGEDLINDVLSQIRCFCHVQCSCKEVDFIKIHGPKWFNQKEGDN